MRVRFPSPALALPVQVSGMLSRSAVIACHARLDGLVPLSGGVQLDQRGPGAEMAHPFHQLAQTPAVTA
jgi:hypothetical protein